MFPHGVHATIPNAISKFRLFRGTAVALDGLGPPRWQRGPLVETRRTGGEDQVAKEDRGFASMDRAKQREIASKGGKAAHQKGTAHEWTSEEARDAGRKGGLASHKRRREQMMTGGGGASSENANDMSSERTDTFDEGGNEPSTPRE